MSEFHGPGPDRILLVDDDPDIARYIIEVLAVRAGYDVTHAAGPADALRLITDGHFDLVLTDIEMPGMTGIEMLGQLRQIVPAVPVAVITAHATVGNAVGALQGKADEFLQKPLRPDELVAAVAGLLERHRATRERVLAVGAHPDDVEIGAAGTLLAHRAARHEVAILTMSRGARGGTEEARVDESRTAARLLGATLHLEDLEDTRISEGDPTISAISRVIDLVQPTIVYTHSPHDVHQDHRNTHRAVMVAARGVGSLYCFQSPSATVDFRPARFISIDPYLAGKVAAIGAFGSQIAVRQYLEPDLIEATARYWSRFAECRYAEAFEVIRDHAASALGAAAPRVTEDARQSTDGGNHAAA